MAIELRSRKIAYIPIPKVACTSLKIFFYELLFDKKFEGNSELIHHTVWGTHPYHEQQPYLYDGWRVICVVRDPLERFLSGYNDRVLDRGELDERAASAQTLAIIDKFNLPRMPDVSVFIKNFSKYCGASDEICHHFLPQGFFIGNDLSFYNKVFRMSEVHEIPEYIEAGLSGRAKVPSENATLSRKISPHNLTRAEVHTLMDYYAGDYALLSHVYPATDSFSRFTQSRADHASIDIKNFMPNLSGTTRDINCYRTDKVAFYCEGLIDTQVYFSLGSDIVFVPIEETPFDEEYFLSIELLNRSIFVPGASYCFSATAYSKASFTFGIFLRACAKDGERIDFGGTHIDITNDKHEFSIELKAHFLPGDFASVRTDLILYVKGRAPFPDIRISDLSVIVVGA